MTSRTLTISMVSSMVFLFVACATAKAQVAETPANFLLPAFPKPASYSPKEPFEKTIRIAGTEHKITSTGWTALGSHGAEQDGETIRLRATPDRESVQICQTLTFEPPLKTTMYLSCRCKAEISRMERDCALYLDLFYDDDTPLWGQAVQYGKGNFDFREGEYGFMPAKPVKKVQVFLLLRKAEGTAWFDRLYFGPAPVLTPRLQALGGLFGHGSAAAFVRPSHPASDLDISVQFCEPDGTTLLSRPQPLRTEPLILSGNERSDDTNSADAKEILVAGSVARNNDTVLVARRLNTEACDAGRGYCLWTTTATERIFPYSLPRIASDDATETPTPKQMEAEMEQLRRRLQSPSAALELAKNEYESFQIALLSPNRLDGVEIEFSDLLRETDPGKAAANGDTAKIDKKNLDWKQVGFVLADKIRFHPKETEGMPGWWPDPLLPVERFDVPAGQTQPVWITLYVPRETLPGRYRGTVTVKPKNAPKTEIPLSVTVWNFELPEEGNCRTAFALMDGFLEKVYDIRPTTPELRRRYGDFMLRHRLTPEGDISRTAPPVLDELEYYRGRGLGAFNILNMVEPRGNATWRCNSPTSVYTPEFKAKMLETLKPYVEELRTRGLAEQAYVYTFDERSEDYAEIMTEFFGMVKEHFPEVATFTTSYFPPDVETLDKLNVDWICPLTSVYDYEKAQRCREAGKQVWSYICCGPVYPYANVMFRFPLIESRLIFWQAYHEQFDGLLYWGMNIWSRPSNVPIDPAKGPFLDWSVDLDLGGPIYGDGLLLYAGIGGEPIGSIRLANLRDGLEDYEYFHLLRLHTDSLEEARRRCRTLTPSLTEYSRSPTELYQQRRAVAAELDRTKQ